jgi:nitrate reductase NapE component
MRNVTRAAGPEKMTPRIYAIMAVTTVLTFGTLVAGYQLLFPPHSMFA